LIDRIEDMHHNSSPVRVASRFSSSAILLF
jgi:hypothetical protein